MSTGNVKGNSVWRRNWLQVLTSLQTIVLRAYICCLCTVRKGHCQYPSFAIITINMLVNIYLMVHVYASPPLQKYYINSRFIWLYPDTFNQATYAFNSNGKMWPVLIAFDMLCLEFKHLWCFSKLRMTVSTVGFGVSIRPELIHRQRNLAGNIGLHCYFPYSFQ